MPPQGEHLGAKPKQLSSAVRRERDLRRKLPRAQTAHAGCVIGKSLREFGQPASQEVQSGSRGLGIAESRGRRRLKHDARNRSQPERRKRLWPRKANRQDQGNTAGFGTRCGTDSDAKRGRRLRSPEADRLAPQDRGRLPLPERKQSGGRLNEAGPETVWRQTRTPSRDREIQPRFCPQG